MKKEILENLISLNYSQRKIGKNLGYSQGNIKYWLKIFGLKTNNKQYNKDNKKLYTEKLCPRCKKIKLIDDFYKKSNRSNGGGYCKKCSNEVTVERIKNIKIKMIKYKGGCCEDCNLKLENSHYCVFDFHHINPENKDPNFKRIKFQKWEIIKKEIDKCELLCSNCHRIKHAKLLENSVTG